MSLQDAKLLTTPNAYKAGKLYSIKPLDGSGDFTSSRATTATRVNENGLIESVAVNVPRIDYTNRNCPSILVEEQRTNLVKSKDFTSNDWKQIDITATLGGSKNGFTFYNLNNDSGGNSRIQTDLSFTKNTKYCYSLYFDLSETTSDYVSIQLADSENNALISFNTSNLSLTDNGDSNIVLGSLKSVLIADNIYRVSFVYEPSITALTRCRVRATNAGNGATSTTIGESTHVAFPQVEEGTEPSSYIPTTSSAVTRNADVLSTTVPAGVTEIVEELEDGTTNTITNIPATYTPDPNRYKYILMK